MKLYFSCHPLEFSTFESPSTIVLCLPLFGLSLLIVSLKHLVFNIMLHILYLLGYWYFCCCWYCCGFFLLFFRLTSCFCKFRLFSSLMVAVPPFLSLLSLVLLFLLASIVSDYAIDSALLGIEIHFPVTVLSASFSFIIGLSCSGFYPTIKNRRACLSVNILIHNRCLLFHCVVFFICCNQIRMVFTTALVLLYYCYLPIFCL